MKQLNVYNKRNLTVIDIIQIYLSFKDRKLYIRYSNSRPTVLNFEMNRKHKTAKNTMHYKKKNAVHIKINILAFS